MQSADARQEAFPHQTRHTLFQVVPQAKSQEELEKLFWEWTKRPDIQARLYPHRDPDKTRRDAVRLLDQHLLGSRGTFPVQETDPDPACLV